MCNGISEKASTGCAEAFRTSVATGSMRYLSASQVWSRERTAGYENGKCNLYIPGVAKGDWPKYEDHYDAGKTMPAADTRPDIRVGMLVSVYADRIVFAKREFESGLPLDDDWVVELPLKQSSFKERAKLSAPPEFPQGAKLSAVRKMTNTRGSKRIASKSAAARLRFQRADRCDAALHTFTLEFSKHLLVLLLDIS